jgi:hypothetical protein
MEIIGREFDFIADLDFGTLRETNCLYDKIKRGLVGQVNVGFWNSLTCGRGS